MKKLEQALALIKSHLEENKIKEPSNAQEYIEKKHKLQDPSKGFVDFKLYDHQVSALKLFEKFQHVAIKKSRQVGATALLASYATYYADTHPGSKIVVLTNNFLMSQHIKQMVYNYLNPPSIIDDYYFPTDAEIIEKIGYAPERRVFHIDVGAITPDKVQECIETIKKEIFNRKVDQNHQLVLDNESIIEFTNLTKDCFRGRYVDHNLIIIDNLEYIAYSAIDDLSRCMNNTSKIIIAGNLKQYNLFGNLDWKIAYMPWYNMYGRNDAWRLEQIDHIGLERFQKEYELK
jgi:hypothetical protein